MYFSPIISQLNLVDPYWGTESLVIKKWVGEILYDDAPTLRYGLTDPYDPAFMIMTSGRTFELMDISGGIYAYFRTLDDPRDEGEILSIGHT